jgi:thioredoxin reductase (NADPH)
MYDVIIVGAGPSGTSAAIWLKQLGFNPLVIDKQSQCGGLQLSNPYTNTWIATSANAFGRDVADAMHQNMLRHKVEMRLGVEALTASIDRHRPSIIVSLSNGEKIIGRHLILAGGVSPKTGGFVSRIGMIVGPGSAVAETDFNQKRVAVLGGGDSAFENYAVAKSRGAAEVTIFARSIKARAEMIERAQHGDIVVGAYDVDINENSVNGVRYDHILVLYGYEANKSSLLGLEPAMKPSGYISTDGNCLTSIENVFAIGEIAGRWHPCCVTAMADGVAAAKEIQRRLEGTASSRLMGLARRSLSQASKAML